MSTVYCYAVSIPVPEVSPMNSYNSFFDDLMMEVCGLMNIEQYLLYGKGRTSRVKYSRWMIWEIMVACKSITLVDAGCLFKRDGYNNQVYDHSSVGHALDTLPNDLRNNEYLTLIYKQVLTRMDLKFEVIELMRVHREKNKTDRKIRGNKI